jgi:hypothetical protein
LKHLKKNKISLLKMKKMKKLLFFTISLFFLANLIAQNVGIGTTTPTEKLDVNGNANFRNQIKINADSGKANQVLMKNSTNNLVWGDIAEYKSMVVFDCQQTASTAGTSNCTQTWTVPASVTKILIECWGGGGGDSSLTGGGGGGYITAILTVTPLNTIAFTIGAGGTYGNSTSVPVQSGTIGGTTNFPYAGISYSATGGLGGVAGDLFTLNSTSASQIVGGGFFSNAGNNFLGFSGQPAGYSRVSYVQVTATEFGKVVQYGDGGDAAMQPSSGSHGGYRFVSTSTLQTYYATPNGILPGGGGGADYSDGYPGRGGRVIIRW